MAQNIFITEQESQDRYLMHAGNGIIISTGHTVSVDDNSFMSISHIQLHL